MIDAPPSDRQHFDDLTNCTKPCGSWVHVRSRWCTFDPAWDPLAATTTTMERLESRPDEASSEAQLLTRAHPVMELLNVSIKNGNLPDNTKHQGARGHATTGSGTRESRSECGLGIPETFPHEPVSDRGSSPAATQLQQQKSHSPGAADLAMPGGECTVAEEAAPSSAERHCIVIGPPSTATCELQRRRAHNNPRIRDIAQAGVRSS
ncbi:hypothetical protein MRS44_014694 [Fusarium solani]|uniref:uncharacterized protein n=1 Tax=Fusarium solani TaxID=169388 RepID=UPI0032C4357E|nr:hypothetical protein MRS44_014694 [Fusarium solani]